jgi:hypothetical protein
VSGLNIEAIRKALAAQIRANINRETNVSEYFLSAPPYPSIQVVPPGGEAIAHRTSFNDGRTGLVRFSIMVWTASADDISGQKALDDYLSAGGDNQSSLWDALWANSTTEGRITLGGLVNDINIGPATYLPPEGVDGPLRRFGAVLPIEILVKKDAVV